MITLQEQVVAKLEKVIADDVSDMNARYIDTLTRLYETLFYASQELSKKA